MGDLFFVIKMSIYTVIIVIIMQVKIGSTTLEQKTIELTHNSQLASQVQKIAQGAASFIGVQYKSLTKHVNSDYIRQHSPSQIPGQRLKAKIQDIKSSLNKSWEDNKKELKEKTEEKIENQFQEN